MNTLDFPDILPLPFTGKRPFWSVMITAYKRKDYLKEALEGVLRQDPGIDEMQIEVVDDCSPNHEEIRAVVEEVGKGRVDFYSQPKNVGVYENWNTCIRRAQGRWVHILSDDDVVLPDFYQNYRERAELDQTSVVIGPSIYINEKGGWQGFSTFLQEDSGTFENALWRLSQRGLIHTPAIVVSREAYEKVGGFTSSLVLTPDWEMWVRLAENVPFSYVNRPYSLFRVHSGTETSRLMLSGALVDDYLTISKIIQAKFSDPKEQKIVERSINHFISGEAFYLSRKLAGKGQVQASLLYAVWALRLTPSISYGKNLAHSMFSYIKAQTLKIFGIKKITQLTE